LGLTLNLPNFYFSGQSLLARNIREFRPLEYFMKSKCYSWTRTSSKVNFTNILRTNFALIFCCQKLQSWTVTKESCTKHFCTKKNCMQKVEEINYWGRFHQPFYVKIFCAKIPKVQKDTGDLTVFCAFGIWGHKSCGLTCWWSWPIKFWFVKPFYWDKFIFFWLVTYNGLQNLTFFLNIEIKTTKMGSCKNWKSKTISTYDRINFTRTYSNKISSGWNDGTEKNIFSLSFFIISS
jgi:hypothetical protein